MSNHLAIATVTATLQRMLQVAIQREFEGARITTVSPSEVGQGTPETGVNIFMYQVSTNPALHNVDVTPMRSRGNTPKRQAALDLYYMLSCYGNNNELAPQRLLGSVVQAMNDRRVINQEMIQAACQDATLAFLRNSNLSHQVQKINILPLDLNLEDLSKTWSVFFQTPYILSVAYKALVVMVDGRDSLEYALPVRSRQSGQPRPFAAHPYIEQVMAQSGINTPIVADSTLVIKGKHLKGHPRTQVRMGRTEITPPTISDRQITLPLSLLPAQALQAGTQTIQVIHPLMKIISGKPHGRRGAESKGVPFVLRPRVVQADAGAVIELDDDLVEAPINIQTDLTVGPLQKVVLSMSEWWPATSPRDPNSPPATYLFDAIVRTEATCHLQFQCRDIQPREYLLRVLIDGAESLLETDLEEWIESANGRERNPQFNWYMEPRISLTRALVNV